MAGKHAAAGPARGSAIAAFVLVLAVVLAGGGWALKRQLTGALAPSAGDIVSTSCPGGASVRVTAAREVVDAVRAAAKRVSLGRACTTFEVSAADSRLAANALGQTGAPQVWIPDSSTWLDGVAAQDATTWKAAGSVTTSPIVLATPESRLAAVGRPASWASVVNGTLQMSMADPDKDTSSRLAYLASRSGSAPKLDLSTGARLILMSRFAKASSAAILADQGGAAGEPFPLSEQQLASYVQEHPDTALRAVVPRGGTLSMNYPFLVSAKATAGQASAATALASELTSDASQAQLTAAGFRTSDHGPSIGGTSLPAVRELTAPAPADRLAAIQQWDVLRTDMRMLAVMDVSGSMRDPSGTGSLTRFQVLQGAAVKALQILPAGSKVGGWLFSTAQGGPKQDWRVLSPIDRLDQQVGSTTHRAKLATLVRGSTKYLGGDTGLYDTTLAAYRDMIRTWEGGYINSVVVMTDGVNDDTTGGISLAQLLASLRSEGNKAKPVRIITIGMGEADPSALKQISAATGGTSYIANSPADIQRVFVEALLARPLPTS